MKDVERMVISAHEDGEVEAPWSSQVERKLAEDPTWAAEAAVHRRVKVALATSPEPDFSEARYRVFSQISARVPLKTPHTFSMAWMSVAAAAILVLALGSGFWLGRQSAASGASEVAELQVQVPQQLELKLSGEGQLLMASTLEGLRR